GGSSRCPVPRAGCLAGAGPPPAQRRRRRTRRTGRRGDRPLRSGLGGRAAYCRRSRAQERRSLTFARSLSAAGPRVGRSPPRRRGALLRRGGVPGTGPPGRGRSIVSGGSRGVTGERGNARTAGTAAECLRPHLGSSHTLLVPGEKRFRAAGRTVVVCRPRSVERPAPVSPGSAGQKPR